ncbi:hypothetical protein LJR030_000523 [Rhizobium sp. LjRoot30]
MLEAVSIDTPSTLSARCPSDKFANFAATNEDKRRAVMTLLQDAEWMRWNDVRVAKAAGVSSMFVGRVRKELSLNGLMMPSDHLSTVDR